MGGRGGTGGTAIVAIRRNVELSDWWQSTKQYTKTPEKLLNSPTFMGSVKDAIGKEAFKRDYEITENKLILWLKKWSESCTGRLKRQRRKRNLRKSTQKDIFGNIITQIVDSGKLHHRHTKWRNGGCVKM